MKTLPDRSNTHPVRQALRLLRLYRQIGFESSPERARARLFDALGLSDNIEEHRR